jgi:hypothetical protein
VIKGPDLVLATIKLAQDTPREIVLEAGQEDIRCIRTYERTHTPLGRCVFAVVAKFWSSYYGISLCGHVIKDTPEKRNM